MIAIVDYGLGNISAFADVYKRLNIHRCIANTIDKLKDASKIILPGVGSFDEAMTLLNNSGMRQTLEELVLKKKVPVLGICVGMQILARSSEEGVLPGLGWINGEVKKIKQSYPTQNLYIPHMGWDNIISTKPNPLLIELENDPYFYFLHSYCFFCSSEEDVIAITEYGGKFVSVLNHENIYGIQCHPEKSHKNGIQLLKNFANL